MSEDLKGEPACKKLDAFLDRRPIVTFLQRFHSCRTPGVWQYVRATGRQLEDVVSFLSANLRERFDSTQGLDKACILGD